MRTKGVVEKYDFSRFSNLLQVLIRTVGTGRENVKISAMLLIYIIYQLYINGFCIEVVMDLYLAS